VFNAQSSICQLYHNESKLFFDHDDDVRFVLDQHAELDFYSASLLKQQSTPQIDMSLHSDTLPPCMLIQRQAVVALAPKCCVVSDLLRSSKY